jgi:cardiolipin synthase
MPTDLPNLLTLSRIAAIPLLVALVALLVGAALMMLVGQNRLSGPALYPAIVIMLREILVSGLREYLAGIRIGLPVTPLAKWKTGFQMGALGTLLAGDTTAQFLHLGFLPVSMIGEAMLWVAAGLTLWTGWDYLTAGWRHATVPADPLRKRQLPS